MDADISGFEANLRAAATAAGIDPSTVKVWQRENSVAVSLEPPGHPATAWSFQKSRGIPDVARVIEVMQRHLGTLPPAA